MLHAHLLKESGVVGACAKFKKSPRGGVVELQRSPENLLNVTEDELQVSMHAFVIDGLLIAIQNRVLNCVPVKAM